ncbi:MAG: hypothetical protein ACUVS7_17725, partial [Bryobacteraceae bacterium]
AVAIQNVPVGAALVAARSLRGQTLRRCHHQLTLVAPSKRFASRASAEPRAAAPRREGTLGKLRLGPIQKALAQRPAGAAGA